MEVLGVEPGPDSRDWLSVRDFADDFKTRGGAMENEKHGESEGESEIVTRVTDAPWRPTDDLPKPRTHRLKTWPVEFQQIVDGKKTFEFRRNDRDFRVGDNLLLIEFDPNAGGYGAHFWTFVSSIVEGKDMHSVLASQTYSILAGCDVVINKDKTPITVRGLRIVPVRARDKHKSVTFSYFYLGGPGRVYSIMGDVVRALRPNDIREACRAVHRGLADKMPVLTKFLKEKVNEANTVGYLRAGKLNRIRYFKNAYGDAANNNIQLINAEAIKLAMVNMDRWLTQTGYGRLALNVHDQLVTSCKPEYSEIVGAKQADIMADSLSYFLTSIKGAAGYKITKYWEK
jgi:hypothetical protein